VDRIPFSHQAKDRPVADPMSRARKVLMAIFLLMESTPLTRVRNMLLGGLLEKMNGFVSVLEGMTFKILSAKVDYSFFWLQSSGLFTDCAKRLRHKRAFHIDSHLFRFPLG